MIRRVACSGLLFAAVLAAAFTLSAHAAETVTVRAAEHDSEGFGRIAFDWPAPVEYQATIKDGTLSIHFARPLTAKLDAIAKHLDGYVTGVKLASDGAGILAEVKHPATLHSFTDGNVVAVDIVLDHAAKPAASASKTAAKPAKVVKSDKPAKSAKAGAPAPQAPVAAAAETVPIRFAEHPGYRRLVFDWHRPVDYSLTEKDGLATLRFARTAKLDPKRLTRAVPELAPSFADEDGATIVSFTVPAGISFRHFRSGESIVLDVLGKSSAAAAKPAAGVTPPPELVEPSAGSASDGAKRGAGTSTSPVGTPRPLTRPSAAASPPAPPGAMPVHYTALAPQGASLRFDWPTPTGAAVFQRGQAIWIVFSGAKPLNLAEPRKLGGAVMSTIDQVTDARATVLRLVPVPGVAPSVRRAENGWIVELRPQEAKADAPIAIEPHASAPSPDVLFAVHGAAAPIQLRDPDVGDALTVIPVAEPGRGVGETQDFVDFSALASVQGIVIRPKADNLTVSRTGDGVVLGRPGGLVLSPESDRRLAHLPGSFGRLFDFAAWRGHGGESFMQKRSELEQAIAAAPPGYRSKPRLALARFYFANLYAPEAEGVLAAVARDDPKIMNDPPVLLLDGAVHLLAGDTQRATEELSQKSLDGEPEAVLWRAALAAQNRDWPAAAHGFALASNLLPRYPQELRNRFALQAARSFLETNQPDQAQPMTELVLRGDPPVGDKGMALYLNGRRALALGDYAGAMDLWNKAAALDDRPSRARAQYARIMAQLTAKQISRADAIKALDKMRFAWRGDMFEFTLLRKLGELKVADGDLRGGLDTLREAATNFPDYPASKDVMKEISDSFASAFLDKDSESLSPVKALTLYDEFKDYAPVGEQGDVIVRRLVDRLVAVDLLDRAGSLLDDQVNHRLTGRDKARAAAQLALVRLLDGNPAGAVKALDIDVGKDVPPELAKEREQLRARALSQLNHDDEALALLANDTSHDADRLRADIYWRAKNWREAAKVFARLVPPPRPDGTLDKDAGQMVLNWASALTLAGDQQGLAALRATYEKPMAGTPYADAFRVIAGDIVSGSDSDPRVLASRVAQVDQLQSFMASLKERLAKDKVSEIN